MALLLRREGRPEFAGPLRRQRRRAGPSLLAVAATAGLLALSPGRGATGIGGDAPAAKAGGAVGEEEEPALVVAGGRDFTIPARHAEALTGAWKKVDALSVEVDQHRVLPDFGSRAEAVIKRALVEANVTGTAAASLEKLLDAPLRALFQRQLQSLVARSTDLYEAQVSARPNPLEASRVAEEAFLSSAAALVRPGSGWEFEAEHRDLLALLAESYNRDAELVDEQAKQGRGGQTTIQVIRKLQEQQAAVHREVETRGAFPWNVKWQYMVENSPVGFRGQYTQGRSVVELLLMPSPDPRYAKNLLNRIGPLNLAVAFDMLL